MKNLCFILMLLIITTSACKKDKSQPTVITPAKQDSTIVKPNDTPVLPKRIVSYYSGLEHYWNGCRDPYGYQNKDTTYEITYIVVEKDSTISFHINDTTKPGATYYKKAKDEYMNSDGRYNSQTFAFSNDILTVSSWHNDYYCSSTTYFQAKKK